MDIVEETFLEEVEKKSSIMTISDDLLRWIESNLPKGSTILELGSGHGTRELIKNYKVYSVEHDKRFIGLCDSNYIYAPIVNNTIYSPINLTLEDLEDREITEKNVNFKRLNITGTIP